MQIYRIYERDFYKSSIIKLKFNLYTSKPMWLNYRGNWKFFALNVSPKSQCC